MEPAVLVLINAEQLLFEKQIEVKLMCIPPTQFYCMIILKIKINLMALLLIA